MTDNNSGNNSGNNNGEPTEPTEPTNNSTPDADGKVDGKTAAEWKAEHDKWKGHSRTWENRANNSEREFSEYKSKHGSDEEKAAEKAKEEGRQEERAKFANTMVELEFRAANKGRLGDAALEAILPGLNRSQFLSDNGNDVDKNKVESFIAGIAPSNSNGTTDNSGNTNNSGNNGETSQHGAGGAGNNNSGGSGKGSLDEGAELYKNRSSSGRRF